MSNNSENKTITITLVIQILGIIFTSGFLFLGFNYLLNGIIWLSLFLSIIAVAILYFLSSGWLAKLKQDTDMNAAGREKIGLSIYIIIALLAFPVIFHTIHIEFFNKNVIRQNALNKLDNVDQLLKSYEDVLNIQTEFVKNNSLISGTKDNSDIFKQKYSLKTEITKFNTEKVVNKSVFENWNIFKISKTLFELETMFKNYEQIISNKITECDAFYKAPEALTYDKVVDNYTKKHKEVKDIPVNKLGISFKEAKFVEFFLIFIIYFVLNFLILSDIFFNRAQRWENPKKKPTIKGIGDQI